MEFKTSNGTFIEAVSEKEYPEYITLKIFDISGEMSELYLDLKDARKICMVVENMLKLREQIDE